MLLPWINTIALNCHRRAIRRERSLYFELKCGQRAINPTATNLAAIEISRALQRCDPRSRGLLEAQMSGRTVKELAAEHGVTETAIRIRLFRARRMARVLL
jgi:DNA-directed RNA polymerase specialized sigma24 family protein